MSVPEPVAAFGGLEWSLAPLTGLALIAPSRASRQEMGDLKSNLFLAWGFLADVSRLPRRSGDRC